eukprot:TRINITY_DN8873_c0_g1_i4.p1 TRINITY_DN8873_c0_g1~~TRINITY_DN8873_c0_g1_i4.p1  ORF type:complete len:124 (+),score=10.64 TRINITY_DN8873_c0_g1_i4:590-961(+)
MKRTTGTALLFVSCLAMASELRVTGTYSNLRFGTEDLSGVEVTIVSGGTGYYAVVQCAEGAPGIPLVVPAQVHGARIEFRVTAASSGCPEAAFTGAVTAAGLTGVFEGTQWPGFLKRGKSYWQ